MNIDSLANHVEANITRLFKKFKEKPAVFLSKPDITCYLYHLLIFDPFLRHDPKIKNFTPTLPQSKTFLVHAGLEVSVDGQNKPVALSVGEVKKETDLPGWDFPIGIEVAHNFDSSVASWIDLRTDVKKIARYKKGYLLCLNWSNPLTEVGVQEIESFVAKYASVEFCYLDLCSKPLKTNLSKI
ncbi:MAG TPA: hypothetical protein V6C97_01960 [Oculatellaceae cyanobacterium]